MAYVFTLLLLAAGFAALLGLIRPGLIGAKSRGSALLRSGGAAIVAFIGVAATVPRHGAPEAAQPPAAVPTPAPVPVAAPPPPPPPPLPDAQARLIGIVDEYAQAYRAAPNEMAKGATRPARAAAICAAMKPEVRDWRGTVEELGSTERGDGTLSVRVSPAITLQTWRGDRVDAAAVIRAASPMHTAIMAMRPKQRVIFSGQFIAGPLDCFVETHSDFYSTLTRPAFQFRFTDVRAAD